MKEDNIIDSVISFQMECWDEKGESSIRDIKEKVIRIIKDPLGRHETKYAVEYEGDEYLIPISEITNIEYYQTELFS